jgi:Rrf2 family transcriptional regulator, iron-sulfur cluster assembly transcription factor
MKLSTRSRYGTRILIELANNLDKGPLQISEISNRQKLSVKYCEQLIRPLKKAKLVNSIRGPKGGHILNKSPEKITLGEIVRLFEGQTDLVHCISAPEDCSRASDCPVRLVWQEATRALYKSLDSTTIADLLEGACCDG